MLSWEGLLITLGELPPNESFPFRLPGLFGRSKVVLNNTISKLERKINELTEQIEEDQKLAQEHKDTVMNLRCVRFHLELYGYATAAVRERGSPWK